MKLVLIYCLLLLFVVPASAVSLSENPSMLCLGGSSSIFVIKSESETVMAQINNFSSTINVSNNQTLKQGHSVEVYKDYPLTGDVAYGTLVTGSFFGNASLVFSEKQSKALKAKEKARAFFTDSAGNSSFESVTCQVNPAATVVNQAIDRLNGRLVGLCRYDSRGTDGALSEIKVLQNPSSKLFSIGFSYESGWRGPEAFSVTLVENLDCRFSGEKTNPINCSNKNGDTFVVKNELLNKGTKHEKSILMAKVSSDTTVANIPEDYKKSVKWDVQKNKELNILYRNGNCQF